MPVQFSQTVYGRQRANCSPAKANVSRHLTFPAAASILLHNLKCSADRFECHTVPVLLLSQFASARSPSLVNFSHKHALTDPGSASNLSKAWVELGTSNHLIFDCSYIFGQTPRLRHLTRIICEQSVLLAKSMPPLLYRASQHHDGFDRIASLSPHAHAAPISAGQGH